MSIYEINLECLKKHRKELFDLIEKPTVTNVRVVYTGTTPNLLINDNLVYKPTSEEYYKGITIPSQKRNLFVIGCGLGFWYHKIQESKESRPLSYFVIEKDAAIFKAWLSVIDITEAIKNKAISFIVGVPKEELYEAIHEAISSNPIMARKHLAVSGFMEDATAMFDREYYKESANFILQASEQALADFGNDIEDSFFGFENLLMNVKRCAALPGVKEWYGKAKGIPGIVVGAGPSLDKNKALLTQWKGKAVIGSCDTALPLLLKDGIVPDFVSSIERTPTTIKYYEGLKDDPNIRKVIFAPAAVIRPEIYKLCSDDYGMPTIAVFRDFKHFEWVPFQRGIIRSGKSATHLIFKMLIEMGCNPIILVGQDCAFGDNETHAKGADHSSEGMKKSVKYKHQMTIMGNNGKPVKTLRVWYDFKRTYEEYIKKYPDIQVINCTEGGALIEGAKVMTLENALMTFGDKVAPVLSVVPNAPEQTTADTGKLMQQRQASIEWLSLLEKDCNNMLAMEDKNTLNAVVEQIMHQPQFSLIMMHLIQSYLFWWTNTMNGLAARKAPEEEMLKCLKEYVSVMKEVAIRGKRMFEEKII